ncbi:MAG: glycosyltransferase [Candidatus Hydrogenedentes bacterium]|nr:glycosyltransferase [Candidatus Hydrogenedentota bacterium]
MHSELSKLRVCILGQMTPLTWMPHLISAFQSIADVRTIGPLLHDFPADAWPGTWPPRDHADVELDKLDSLYDALPSGWTPHLVIAISGGGIPMFTNTHDLPCPTVFYSVDTWQCYMDYLEALHYDIVFAGQRAYVPHLRAAGSRHVYWLPMACNPDLHKPIDAEELHDITFVGGLTEPVHWQRAQVLKALQQHFDVHILARVYGAAMNDAYASGRVAFNHAAVQDVNMRIFEALAMGRALLTNRDSEANGLTELFENEKHLLIYDDERDLVRKASRLLSDDSLRERLQREGREAVLAHHTYAHRVHTMLGTVRALCPGFDACSGEPPTRGENLVEYLPLDCTSLLDYGVGLGASRLALARRGVTRFDGFTTNSDLRRQRAGSYHALHESPPADTFDSAAIDYNHVTDTAICSAWQVLVQGGTLLIKCDARQLTGVTDLNSWFRQRDFHVVQSNKLAAGSTIIVLRKRTRRLRDIARDVCSVLNVPGVTAESVVGLLDADW